MIGWTDELIIPIFAANGLTAADAVRTFMTFAVALGVMHLVGGMLADRLPLNGLLAVAVAGLSGSILMLQWATTPATAHVYAVLMGCSQGLLTAASGPLWPRYYGRSHLGRIRGLASTVLVVSSSVGPFMVGAAYDYLGGYREVLWLMALLPLPLSVAALFATQPVRRGPAAPADARIRDQAPAAPLAREESERVPPEPGAPVPALAAAGLVSQAREGQGCSMAAARRIRG